MAGRRGRDPRQLGADGEVRAGADRPGGRSGPDLVAQLEEVMGAEPGLDARIAGRHWQSALLDPAREFLERPGKLVRARVCEYAHALAGGEGPPPDRLLFAVELLHAGSLIVDDIEDGAERRRGGPALHRARGLAPALNTGNWFYFLALGALGRAEIDDGGAPAERSAVGALTRCHEGQALDVSMRVFALEQGEVPGAVAAITSLKTAALTELSGRLAAAAAGAPARARRALAGLGHELGVYLQMLDDLSGVLARGRRDKGAEDLAAGRATWPWAWLAEAAAAPAFADLQERARAVAAGSGAPERVLDDLAADTARAGRSAAGARLSSALAHVREELTTGRARAIADELEAEMRELEGAFVG